MAQMRSKTWKLDGTRHSNRLTAQIGKVTPVCLPSSPGFRTQLHPITRNVTAHPYAGFAAEDLCPRSTTGIRGRKGKWECTLPGTWRSFRVVPQRADAEGDRTVREEADSRLGCRDGNSGLVCRV